MHVVMTGNATRFVSALTFESLARHPVFVDQFALGDDGDIRHISLADAADLLLVAPATANTLGKFAHGIADDALSHAVPRDEGAGDGRAGDERQHVRPPGRAGEPRRRCARAASSIVEPGEGYLACGWLGRGRLAEVPEIVEAALALLARKGTMAGAARAGQRGPDGRGHRPRPLRLEPLDREDGLPAGRGRARPRGRRHARVRSHGAPGAGRRHARAPCGRPKRCTARSTEHAASADIVAMAAAVSDYRPADAVGRRRSRSPTAPLALELVRTPDILRGLGAAKGRLFLVGFAAETDQVLEHAREKRQPEERRPAGREQGRHRRRRLRGRHERRGADRRARRDRGPAHQQARAGRADLGPRRLPAVGDAGMSDERALLLADLRERAAYFATLTDLGLPRGRDAVRRAGRGARHGAGTRASRRGAGPPPRRPRRPRRSSRSARDLGDCQRCVLAKTRTKIVFGQGNPAGAPDVRGRGAGRRRGRAGPRVRGQGRASC